jgi:ATP-dependent RNA helicase DDX6/DHH1
MIFYVSEILVSRLVCRCRDGAHFSLRSVNKVHVLVATPGRVLDLGGKGIADLKQCKVMVMDEADKLLSPEFQPVIEQVIDLLPKEKQILLFSATFPMLVKSFKVSFMVNQSQRE